MMRVIPSLNRTSLMSHVTRSDPEHGLFIQKLGLMSGNAAGTFTASTYLTIAAGLGENEY